MIARWMMVASALLVATPAVAQEAPSVESLAPRIATLFDDYVRDQHVPGLVYGVVKDGKLVIVRGIGVQDTAAKRPVTADSRFRIASMSKAFTALAILDLRDAGKLSLDALAETYVPEMKGWTYPTADSPRIRVRDLMTHTAGFVDDNPWGDRQQSLPEGDFTRMLAAGVPFSRAPESAMEYSNFGYATLGRIVTNVSGKPFEEYIAERILRPLGMTHTGYDVFTSPPGERALGYRWQDNGWVREPDMARGAFGAMGGLETSANDYARYVAWLLSAWPARDGAEKGPLTRATVRSIVQGSNFARLGNRSPAYGDGPCPQAAAYGAGWQIISDCDINYVTHTGGYPGYGSAVMLVPDAGVAVFAFSNRTYGAPTPPTYRTLKLLKDAGLLDPRPVALSPALAAGYAAAAAIWRAGDVMAAPDRLAMNFLLDRTADRWKAELATLREKAGGTCRTDSAITPTTAMAGRFTWDCGGTKIAGSILLAPTATPTLQELRLTVVPSAQ
jgi:CubicO group peptidase (beta-lactamase class C family)